VGEGSLLPLVNVHCCFPSRSHLQPPSYGPVLSPMNKVHGGVNKLPSVNQLVGQPPPHSSAAGPNLGSMGESLGQCKPCVGHRDSREGLGGFTNRPDGGWGWGFDGCLSLQLQPAEGRWLWGEGTFVPIPGVLCLGVCKADRVKNSCLSSLDSHGILKKIPGFSQPQFVHQQNGNTKSPHLKDYRT